MSQTNNHIDYLRIAELQFRLASAVRIATTLKKQPLDLPVDWSHGNHSVHYDEIALTEEQGDFSAWSLHRSATFLIAVAIKDAIKATIPDPKNHVDSDIRSAYQISRMIRNAFAHSPFDPIWSIDPDCRDQVFKVRDIIILDTTKLQATRFDWRHYGGPLAILRLSQFVRKEILNDSNTPRKVIPIPKDIYFQQGNQIFERVDRIPNDAKKIE